MFYDVTKLPFVERLERSWTVVRDEAAELAASDYDSLSGLQAVKKPGIWTTVIFFDAIGGRPEPLRVEENCALCPRTVELVEAIPGLQTAALSRLGAGQRIRPHCDSRAPVRCHLGLVVAEPERCAIRCAGTTRRWQEGKCLALDSTQVHEAWNRGRSDRLLLVIDVDPSALGTSAAECLERPTVSAKIRSVDQWARYGSWQAVRRVKKKFARGPRRSSSATGRERPE